MRWYRMTVDDGYTIGWAHKVKASNKKKGYRMLLELFKKMNRSGMGLNPGKYTMEFYRVAKKKKITIK